MSRVVTVAREYGSGGGQVARRLAERLGWKLLDRCLVEKIAQAARVDFGLAQAYDEHLDPWFNRLAKTLWQGSLIAGPLPEVFDADAAASITEHMIREAAEMGNCVIVGRGSQCILQSRSDAFHVFVYAPQAEKVRRVRGRRPDLTHAGARELVEAQDRERAAFVRRFYDQDWSNRHLYHLMVSSNLGEEAAVSTILAALGAATEKPASANQATRQVA